ncbi:peptidase domain-containing ABC transporter [Prolixibacteraceae bacterium JC049]|nr:peptidase domain-containing ABC transporter [Prolixibacteraceae bacterium JC049]
MSKFPHYKQPDEMDCGVTCLRMIAKYYGKTYSLQFLREQACVSREGVSLMGISDAAEVIGLRPLGAKVTFEQLVNDVPRPCIVHWAQKHFVVLFSIKKKRGKLYFEVADPAYGIIRYTEEEFKKNWLATVREGEEKGICLMLETMPEFFEHEDEKGEKTGFRFLFSYLQPHRKLMGQLALGFLVGSILQLIFPFLTQSIVDVGINNNDLNFIYLVLGAQMILFISRMSVDFVRSWILLHISTRINISIISDFLIKLMRMPIGFFDSKMVGDLLQRIGDHRRIERFLTSQSLSVLFSLFNLVLFGAVLAYYSWSIFAIFLFGSILYVGWILLFMGKRRELDFRRFDELANNQSKLIQLISGMQEIKLNNYETHKRWEWERIQARVFRISVKSLALNQYQKAGSIFINETKNIIITVLAALAVVNGQMTLGMMLAVQYILGQLNGPLDQLVGFMHIAQDAKISLERLGEIHNKEDEEERREDRLNELPEVPAFKLENVTFQYEGPRSEKVLNNVSLDIPANKTTAIVGTSGSGKTTLVKLLLGFYKPVAGEMKVDETPLDAFDNQFWRSQCGAVMQDGFIFSDSIANNIAMETETINRDRFRYAVRMANVHSFVNRLPLGFNTKIGQEGMGLSQGQKQRILIARAIYKNPQFLFFDEATNALDANNEKVIMENLDKFFEGKTVVVVAHRLSTVRNADQIVVLERGEIVEKGTHEELTEKRGAYYQLVKNQLELGG